MARQRKTRRITDIMPVRKADKHQDNPTKSKGRSNKPTRYELDALAKEEKKKRKHKGLVSGSRHNVESKNQNTLSKENKDPRIGSRKKIPLIVEFVNKPEKGKSIPPVKMDNVRKLDPMIELENLENNECLNQLLDDLDTGKKITIDDQKFVDECLARIAELMEELGIDDEENEEDLYRTFENIDIRQFK